MSWHTGEEEGKEDRMAKGSWLYHLRPTKA